MSDYYVLNRTYFLSGSKIYSSEGSGSIDRTNGVELTKEWFFEQNNLDAENLINISQQVSGSYYYMRDHMGF